MVEVAGGGRGGDNEPVGRGDVVIAEEEKRRRARARAFALGLPMPVYNVPVLIQKSEPEESDLMEEI